MSRYSPLTLLGKAINRGVMAFTTITGDKQSSRAISQGIKAAEKKRKKGELKYKTYWDNPSFKSRGIHGIPAPFSSELKNVYKKKSKSKKK
mgnify:CR=1 FL=1